MVYMGAPVVSAFDIQIAPAGSPSPAGPPLFGGAAFSAMGRAKTLAIGRAAPVALRASSRTVSPLRAGSASIAFAPAPDTARFGKGTGLGPALGGGSPPSGVAPISPPSPPSVPLPGLGMNDPSAVSVASSGGPSSSGPGGERAAMPGGDRADESEFAVKVPTWLLVGGAIVFAGLGAFALHRVLPSKR